MTDGFPVNARAKLSHIRTDLFGRSAHESSAVGMTAKVLSGWLGLVCIIFSQ